MKTQTQFPKNLNKKNFFDVPSEVIVKWDRSYLPISIVIDFEKNYIKETIGDPSDYTKYYEKNEYSMKRPEIIKKVVRNLIKWYGIKEDPWGNKIIYVRKKNIKFLRKIIEKYCVLERYFQQDPVLEEW